MNWSEIFRKRYEIHKKWPQIWDLPINRKRFSLLTSFLSPGNRFLEVGADKREWKSRLESFDPTLIYRSMDINQDQQHDWYDLNNIDEKFNAAMLFEVIEHVHWEQGLSMIQKIHNVLEPGGMFFITTPNIFCPAQYFRDITHVQHWAYDELGGALLACQFEVVGIWRLWNGTLVDRMTRLTLGKYIHQYVGTDFAKTIMIVAKKI